MKTTTTSQMSHTRPFRWRRKQQDDQRLIPQDEQLIDSRHTTTTTNHHHQHLTLRSSAIGHHHHPLSYEQNSNMRDMNACDPHQAAMALQPTITHSRRYSPTSNSTTFKTTTTTTTTTAAATTTTAMSHKRRRTPPSSSTTLSLPMLMSLSIIVCVISSLLNLTIDQMQPKMVVAIGTSGTVAASAATPTPSQSSATMLQQQQQQSNSVIQYPAVSVAAVAATTPTTKAKYKTMYACEDRQLTMDCETGSKINLIRANFGRFSITQCNEQGQLDLSTDCMSPITFRIMQERCQDRQRCSVNATSSLFGDRCPKTRKYLEVHFQCQMMEPDVVDVRKPSQVINLNPVQTAPQGHLNILAVPKPPNNPTTTTRQNPSPINNYEQLPSSSYNPDQNWGSNPSMSYPSSTVAPSSMAANPIETTNNNQPTAVINSQVMTPAMALNNNQFDVTNKLPDLDATREPIIVSLQHLQVENMARPRCYQWDSLSRQWTERGARILETNQTHSICAFDQQSSYVLVMDYSGPNQSISPNKRLATPQPSNLNLNGGGSRLDHTWIPDLFENQPMPIDNYPSTSSFPNPSDDGGKMIHPPTSDPQQNQQQQQQQASSTRLFLYLLGIIFVAVALMTLTFVASSMRSSAGAALKSLGNFAPFSGPKYKHRRQNGDPSSLHSNKDLLVINNSNGHSFIYAPASTTKISSSSSTHILSAGQPVGINGQHQAGTLHRLQQQQMYSGNGNTLSSLSGTGAQSNNYYYGLMGLNPLQQQHQQQQQQQQQQHHFSQHHLNQPQPQAQQAQLVGHQQQVNNTTTSYNHQANKSSVSNDSANSSASSSGVESGSASMQQQQQQQARTQQACLVSAMNNNDFHLMGHHISNYGQHQPQQHNLFATLKGASVTHQPHQHQPTFTVNAHYSTSGGINGNGGLQSINMTPNQASAILHNRQASNQMRDHIYECVDDEKPYMARLLMPTQTNSQHQIFGSPTFMSARRTTPNECGVRQK